jgi:succinate-semialdehyde dehydrogenase/glutarate-semialdehyde dehydrogenase
VFGPVAAVIEAHDEDDAIEIANASEFGLGSGVPDARPRARRAHRGRTARGRPQLRQRQRAFRPAPAVRRGQAFGLRARVRRHGIREFVNIKTVQIARPE